SSWPKCEVPNGRSNVRFWEQIGKHLLAMSISHFDPELTPSASLSFFIEHIAQNARSRDPVATSLAFHGRGLKPGFPIYIRIRIFESLWRNLRWQACDLALSCWQRCSCQVLSR